MMKKASKPEREFVTDTATMTTKTTPGELTKSVE